MSFSSPGIHSFIGNVPFYLTWDLDGIYQAVVWTDRNEDDRYALALKIGSKKPVMFKYSLIISLLCCFNLWIVQLWKGLMDTDNRKACL